MFRKFLSALLCFLLFAQVGFAAPSQPPVRLVETIGAKLRRLSADAWTNNPHYNSVMVSPPTITTSGSLPGGQSNGHLRSNFPTFFRESGGKYLVSGNHYESAIIWTSGGNLSGGGSSSVWRVTIIAYANKVTFRLLGSTANYRYIVNGQYVSLTGTAPSTIINNADEYETLDFTSIGGLAIRTVTVEGQANDGFQGVYVGATENIYQPPPAEINCVELGDSFIFGSAATALGDGMSVVMADYLGCSSNTTSGSGGTGWATGGSAYNFLQRVQNGDLALGGTPDLIIFHGSVNDKNSVAATVTANVLAALQLARATYPGVPILVYGVWPDVVASTGSLSVAANEAAVQAGVTAFGDPITTFVPINAANGGPLLTGIGWVGNTTGSGVGDTWMNDNTHLNTIGANAAGILEAGYGRQSFISLP